MKIKRKSTTRKESLNWDMFIGEDNANANRFKINHQNDILSIARNSILKGNNCSIEKNIIFG